MYKTIVNPETGRKVSIHSKIGQNILRNYSQNGGKPCNNPFSMMPSHRQSPDELLHHQLLHSCDRCRKLILLRHQINTQLKHSCTRCQTLTTLRKSRQRVQQLASPMISEQKTQEIRKLFEPMFNRARTRINRVETPELPILNKTPFKKSEHKKESPINKLKGIILSNIKKPKSILLARKQPKRVASPTRNQPKRVASPTRKQPNRTPSPTRKKPPKRKQPKRKSNKP